MLGLVRGRVYYNLLSWYRVLALLPGFTLNRALHGADDGREASRCPQEIADGIARARRRRARWRDALLPRAARSSAWP